MADTQQSALPDGEGPEGIGGWLVLPMLGLMLTPILGLVQLHNTDYLGFDWQAFSFSQGALLVAELVTAGVLSLTAPVLLLFFMFKRWEIFPGWYMIWAVAMPVYAILDPWAAHLVFRESFPTLADAFDGETMRGIYRSVWAAAVWIPYMMRSDRVANTFVN
ncbi:DUF2569 domain-containing protein [Mesorhizobium sp. M1227]|uniref:DUF2569 domain-containing protein n=1 Tax=unclassified Mesorhizobium TaxID=325217 RepID=UPI00333CD132